MVVSFEPVQYEAKLNLLSLTHHSLFSRSSDNCVGSPLSQVVGGIAGKSGFIHFQEDVCSMQNWPSSHKSFYMRFSLFWFWSLAPKVADLEKQWFLHSFGGSDKLPRKFHVNKLLLFDKSGVGTVEAMLHLWECFVPSSPLPLIYLVFLWKPVVFWLHTYVWVVKVLLYREDRDGGRLVKWAVSSWSSCRLSLEGTCPPGRAVLVEPGVKSPLSLPPFVFPPPVIYISCFVT